MNNLKNSKIEDYILEDINTLVAHINDLGLRRHYSRFMSVECELLNHSEIGKFELIYKYMYYDTNTKKINPVITRTATFDYDLFLDERINIVKEMNYLLYQDILTHIDFDPESEKKDQNYKWN